MRQRPLAARRKTGSGRTRSVAVGLEIGGGSGDAVKGRRNRREPVAGHLGDEPQGIRHVDEHPEHEVLVAVGRRVELLGAGDRPVGRRAAGARGVEARQRREVHGVDQERVSRGHEERRVPRLPVELDDDVAAARHVREAVVVHAGPQQHRHTRDGLGQLRSLATHAGRRDQEALHVVELAGPDVRLGRIERDTGLVARGRGDGNAVGLWRRGRDQLSAPPRGVIDRDVRQRVGALPPGAGARIGRIGGVRRAKNAARLELRAEIQVLKGSGHRIVAEDVREDGVLVQRRTGNVPGLTMPMPVDSPTFVVRVLRVLIATLPL